MGLVGCGSSTAIATIAGMLIAPWLTGRAVHMTPGRVHHPALLELDLGYLGLLLGTLITHGIKTVCDHTESLKSVGKYWEIEDSDDYLVIPEREQG